MPGVDPPLDQPQMTNYWKTPELDRLFIEKCASMLGRGVFPCYYCHGPHLLDGEATRCAFCGQYILRFKLAARRLKVVMDQLHDDA